MHYSSFEQIMTGLKKFTLPILLVLSTFWLSSQPKFDNYELANGPFFKVSKRSVPRDFIGFDEDRFYMIYARGKTGTGEKYLLEFGFDLQLKRELKLAQPMERLLGWTELVFWLDGKIYQVATTTFGSTKKIFLQEINKEGWSFEKPQLISEIEGGMYNVGNVDVNVTFSSDSTFVGICYKIPQGNKNKQKMGLHVFDRDLDLVWENTIELPYRDKLLDLKTYKLDQSGNVFVLAKRYYDKRKEKRFGENNYDYLVFKIQQEADLDSLNIASEGKFLSDMQIDIAPNQELISAGFYSDKNSTFTKGAYFMKVDPTSGSTISNSFKEFEDGFLTQNMTEARANRLKKKMEKGKNVELPYFNIDDFIIDERGYTKIIAEQRHIYTVTTYSQYGTVTTTHFDYDDIMLLEIDPEGTFSRTVRVAKNQHTVNDDAVYSSYSFAQNGGNSYFLFNDNAQNLNYTGVGKVVPMQKNSTTMVTIARIDQEGNIVRDALFDRGDVETKVRPALCIQLNEREMLLFGHKGVKTQRFFLLKFK